MTYHCRRGNQDSERLNNLPSVAQPVGGRTKIQTRSVSKIHAISHFCCIFIPLPRVGSFLSNAASCPTRNPAYTGCLVVLPGSCRAGLKILGHRQPTTACLRGGQPTCFLCQGDSLISISPLTFLLGLSLAGQHLRKSVCLFLQIFLKGASLSSYVYVGL